MDTKGRVMLAEAAVIVVTGTKRSGTSMWMQILSAAGLTTIGEPFPSVWEESIQPANPRGFYESRLRNGIFYATNPHPKTGDFLAPGATRRHAVKVFIPGLIRSDMAYLGRVLATVRDWRAYTRSLQRLYVLEDVWLAEKGTERLEQARRGRSRIPAPVEWWFDNYELIRDVSTRRYPFHVTSYARVLEQPRETLATIFGWLGGELDLDAAVAAIDPHLRSQPPPPPGTATAAEDAALLGDAGLDAETIAVFDDYYQAVHRDGHLDSTLLSRMNDTWTVLETRFGRPSRERKERRSALEDDV